MTYMVNECFLSIQGEGYWSGRTAVFVRFSRCNLWTGQEKDRASAICTFCDTDFVHGAPFTADEILAVAREHWPSDDSGTPMVIFTGGEPLLQLDADLVRRFIEAGWYTALETNGTLPLDFGIDWVCIDWVCVSPKTPKIRIEGADELKLVYPQKRITPDLFKDLDVPHFWLSPMDGPDIEANTKKAFDYCLANPQWRLNTQLHKQIGVR